jgi:serine/threonine protein kinase
VFQNHYDPERFSRSEKRTIPEQKYREAIHVMLRILLCVSFRWCLQMMLHMAKALALCHRTGMVHRDVSPENFLFDGWGRLKIIDFASAVEVWPWSTWHCCLVPMYIAVLSAGAFPLELQIKRSPGNEAHLASLQLFTNSRNSCIKPASILDIEASVSTE